MKIAQIMTRDVKTCRAEQNLDVPAQIMWDADCGSVPVIDARYHVVGMITDRDICMAAHLHASSPSNLPVSASMAKMVYTCSADDSLEFAMELMQQHQIRRLPVLGPNKALVGILSINDLIRNLVNGGHLAIEADRRRAVETTLAAVGERRKEPASSVRAR